MKAATMMRGDTQLGVPISPLYLVGSCRFYILIAYAGKGQTK
jgi:hypothetical protein